MSRKKPRGQKKQRGRKPGSTAGYALPPKEHQIKPGEVRNPEGARAHNKEAKLIKKLTEKEFTEITTILLKGSLADLQSIVKEKEQHSVIKVMVAAAAIKIISSGDMAKFDILLDRIIGRVKDKVKVEGRLDGNVQTRVVITLPSNGRERRAE